MCVQSINNKMYDIMWGYPMRTKNKIGYDKSYLFSYMQIY